MMAARDLDQLGLRIDARVAENLQDPMRKHGAHQVTGLGRSRR